MKVTNIALFALCGTIALSCGNGNRRVATVEDAGCETVQIITETPVMPVDLVTLVDDDIKAGPIVKERYVGQLPAADGPGIDYDLTCARREKNNNGAYTLVTVYLEGENGRDVQFTEQGHYKTMPGQGDLNGWNYIVLMPLDDSTQTYFLIEKNGDLTLLDKDMKRPSSELNYTLKKKTV